MKNYKQDSKTKKLDIEIYKSRIERKNLIWVEKITNSIKKKISKKKYKINDIGCNLFQFYKGLKKKKLLNKFSYFGYDHDRTYIQLGLKYFPELRNRFKILNIEKQTPRKTDISVISATLEHFCDPDRGLNNILKSTKKVIFIRSFFGRKKIKKLFKDKKYVDNPYYVNQFTFSWLKNKLKKYDFKEMTIVKDLATKGKKRLIYPEIKRKFYIVIAQKDVV